MTPSNISGVELIDLDIFHDNRGSFESLWEQEYCNILHQNFKLCSVNISYNPNKFTLRGMHFQKHPYHQTKIVTCVNGRVWDVAVDLREESPTYKQWSGVELSARSGRSHVIPKGCAHGFITLEDNTTIAYLIDGQYEPEHARSLRWNDPEISIDWPELNNLILSDKDKKRSDL